MKRILMRVVCLCLLIVLLSFMTGCSSHNMAEDGTVVQFTVPMGATTMQIAEILYDNGLIKSTKKFISVVQKSEYDGRLQAGDFEITAGTPYEEIARSLATGSARVAGKKLIVPEGFSAQMIAVRVSDLGLCTEQEFLDALNDEYDYSFLEEAVIPDSAEYRVQGFLFPNTYEFAKEVTAHEIIDVMLSQFEKEINAINMQTDRPLYEIITIASLVERESVLEDERAMIAGVIENRLSVNMPLQVDATVIYAVSDGKYDMDKVYYSHLKTDSLYNTYKYPGLPAGPICNPGIASIKAAIAPSEHDYLYYHTDEEKKDGSHIFTKTLSEHNATM